MNKELVKFLLILNKLLIISRYKINETNVLSTLNLIQKKSVHLMNGREEAIEQLIEEALLIDGKIILDIENQYSSSYNEILSETQCNTIFQYLQLINVVIEEIKALILLNKYQRAFELVDAIHCLPEMLIQKNWNAREYWEVFIHPYREKWDSSFLFEMENTDIK
ncbi:hypothetical protein [Paenibacillus nasutitermitis]|uniref:Uncharacterized protein n=1 Tax=Paenibacillus nasutitermitis TaxID=1652958 RepID=A0A916YQN5_9BACL|nr:hypothetical protein [Paenibacillus nasutitermitis]GGD56788.1 hypothetical protein GCM10010911_13160 [Paenibacillus nasutitermitis]